MESGRCREFRTIVSVVLSLFEIAHSVPARSASKGIAMFYRQVIVPRFENLNSRAGASGLRSLAGASGLYFIEKRPFVVINGATTKLSLWVALVLAMFCVPGKSQTLLTELTTDGVEFREGVKVVLPPPSLTGKLSDEQIERTKAELAGNDGWEKFARDSIVAPVTIHRDYVVDNSGNRVGHNVHSAFVVHAKLESLADKELMQQIFGKPESNDASGMKVTEQSAADLKAAGVELPTDEIAGTKVTYSRIEFTLLEKIRLSGVMRIERASAPASTTVAWLLDPKFAANEELRGSWSKVSEIATEPQAYAGWGGYLNVTRVSESPEVLVIESRMLLHELPQWFSASNFVRSKLPLSIQEGARNFRRKLKSQKVDR